MIFIYRFKNKTLYSDYVYDIFKGNLEYVGVGHNVNVIRTIGEPHLKS